jgi:hypothetical protein
MIGKPRLSNTGIDSCRFGGNKMKKAVSATLIVVILLSGFLFSAQLAPAQADSYTLLEFNTMVGIPASLTGAQSLPVMRGISGGGLPWMLTSANGELKADGRLEINVRGLVLAAGPNAGSNPIASFRAIVSCVQADGSVSNVISVPFPATTGPALTGGGDSKIETTLVLPQPCIAPLVFVTSPGGAWFAVTGK